MGHERTKETKIMLITEKQLLVLFDLARWLATGMNNPCPFTKETINVLTDQIYNQQSDQLREIK